MKKYCVYCQNSFETNRKHQIYCCGYCSYYSRRVNIRNSQPCCCCGSEKGIRFIIRKNLIICKECFEKRKDILGGENE